MSNFHKKFTQKALGTNSHGRKFKLPFVILQKYAGQQKSMKHSWIIMECKTLMLTLPQEKKHCKSCIASEINMYGRRW